MMSEKSFTLAGMAFFILHLTGSKPPTSRATQSSVLEENLYTNNKSNKCTFQLMEEYDLRMKQDGDCQRLINNLRDIH